MKFKIPKLNIQQPNWRPLCLGAIAVLMSSGPAAAEEVPDPDTNYFVVTETDNTKILFPVSDKPVITLDGTTVNINSDSRAYSTEVTGIRTFNFIGNTLNDVTSISDGSQGIEHNGDAIIIKGLKEGDSVSLFDIKGIIVSTYKAQGENMAVDLNRIPAGVYILSTKNANYKIKK